MTYDHWQTTNPADAELGNTHEDQGRPQSGWEREFWKLLRPETTRRLKAELAREEDGTC
jgi:hypothetical protein